MLGQVCWRVPPAPEAARHRPGELAPHQHGQWPSQASGARCAGAAPPLNGSSKPPAVMSGTSAVLGGPKGTKAGRAGAAWGCLLRSLVTVWLCRARTTGSSESSGAWAARRPRAWASKSSSRSPPSHRPHRRRVNCPACCRRRAPPRGAGRSTAFGSMSRSHQASAELWCATAARARQGIGPTTHERLWAHAEVPVCQKKGGASRATTGAAEAPAAGRHRGWAPLNRAASRRPHTRQWSKLWAAQ